MTVQHTDFSKDLLCCPGWCGSVDWPLSHAPRGHQFDSGSGHMPRLQAWSSLEVCKRQLISLSLPLPSALSQSQWKKDPQVRINKQKKRKVSMWLSGERTFPAEEPTRVKGWSKGHWMCYRKSKNASKTEKMWAGKSKERNEVREEHENKTTEDIISQGKNFRSTLNEMGFLCLRVNNRLWGGHGGYN